MKLQRNGASISPAMSANTGKVASASGMIRCNYKKKDVTVPPRPINAIDGSIKSLGQSGTQPIYKTINGKTITTNRGLTLMNTKISSVNNTCRLVSPGTYSTY